MADFTSMFSRIAGRLGVATTQSTDSGRKTEENKNPLASVLGGENLVITESAPNAVLGRQIIDEIKEMLNNAPANAAGLMMVLKATAEVSKTIAENLKPNEELQEKIKERLEELKKMEDELKADDRKYHEVLARFKAIFVDVQAEKILDERRAEEHPIQA